jgi:hypothetical protein
MRRNMQTIIVLSLLAIATAAWAHEKGILRPTTRTLTAGDSLGLAGEKFTKQSRLSVALVGIGGRIALATVRTDSAGSFGIRVMVPANASPGAYRLIATADDGDEAGTLDVAVVQASPAQHVGMAHDEPASDVLEPSAEPLMLDRARSRALNLSVVGAIALTFILGGALLRRPRHPM